MLRDEPFLSKLKQKLALSKTLVLECKIDGAALYRDVCKLINNLVSIEFDDLYDDEENTETGENLESSTNTLKPDQSQQVIKTKKSTSDPKNDARFVARLRSLEHFCTYLEIPQCVAEFLKMLIGDRPQLKSLKEVYSLLLFIFNFLFQLNFF